jgi:hypothetical protein
MQVRQVALLRPDLQQLPNQPIPHGILAQLVIEHRPELPQQIKIACQNIFLASRLTERGVNLSKICHPDRSFLFPKGIRSGVEGPAVLPAKLRRS